MEGLEIKEKDFSLTYLNKDFRIDSQFYTKEPAKNSKLKYEKIGNILKKAQYGVSISMNEDGVGYPIYRMNEIHNMLCDMEVSKFADISKNELKTFTLRDRDVVFNRTNSFEWVGRTGLYKKLDTQDFVFASYLVRFIPNESVILPEYLSAFLNSKQGVWDIKRRARQSINQTNVNPEEVKEIEIPLLSITFQEYLKSCFDQAFDHLVASKSTYTQAEQLLLQELNLADFQPSKEPVNVKSFSESFGSSGRLDAEYYQVKYDELEERLIQSVASVVKINDVLNSPITNGTTPSEVSKESGEINFIRVEAFGTNLDFDDSNCYSVNALTYEKYKNNKVDKGDILVSMTGTIGTVSIYNSDRAGIINQNLVKLTADKTKILVSYLALYIEKVGRKFLKKLQTGNVQPYVNIPNFSNLIVPVLEISKQQQIADLVEKSFTLKKQSEHLLEVAKQAVEMAIEQDEETAMEWIQSQL